MKDKSEEELNEYERKCDEIRQVNNGYLKLFEESMSGLSAKITRRHMENADFYLNDYLLLHEPLPMEEGLGRIFGFLDDYYIRKCFATEETWKEMASSIKKFYRCMRDYGPFCRRIIGKQERPCGYFTLQRPVFLAIYPKKVFSWRKN